MDDERDDRWMTVSEAAAMTGYSRNHIIKLLHEGKLSGRMFGVLWQVDRESVVEYVALVDEKRKTDGRYGAGA